jgi:RNase P subunit RPR2
MAEFCKQCAENLFGPDPQYNDAVGRTVDGILVLFQCEGCGWTYVDHLGACRNPTCEEHHGVTEDGQPNQSTGEGEAGAGGK